MPDIAEWISYGRRALPVELIGRRQQRLCAGSECAFVRGVDVVDVDVNAELEALELRTGIAHLDDRVADLQFRVHDRSIRPGKSCMFCCAERRLEEVDELGRTLDDEVRDGGLFRSNGQGRHELSFQTRFEIRVGQILQIGGDDQHGCQLRIELRALRASREKCVNRLIELFDEVPLRHAFARAGSAALSIEVA